MIKFLRSIYKAQSSDYLYLKGTNLNMLINIYHLDELIE